jgi:hypothetical protein
MGGQPLYFLLSFPRLWFLFTREIVILLPYCGCVIDLTASHVDLPRQLPTYLPLEVHELRFLVGRYLPTSPT